MSLTTPRLETDDDVHSGVAARALGVSHKTGRTDGQTRTARTWTIDRSGDGLEAVVASRSRATPPGRQPSDAGSRHSKADQERGGSAGTRPRTRGQRCAKSVLAPLLDEFVAVQTSGAEAADAAIAAGARPQHDRRRRTRRRAARRQELSGDALRQVTRAAKRKREADSEYEHATSRAGRLGLLPPRDRRRRGPAVPRATRLSLEPAVECARRRWPAGWLS